MHMKMRKQEHKEMLICTKNCYAVTVLQCHLSSLPETNEALCFETFRTMTKVILYSTSLTYPVSSSFNPKYRYQIPTGPKLTSLTSCSSTIPADYAARLLPNRSPGPKPLGFITKFWISFPHQIPNRGGSYLHSSTDQPSQNARNSFVRPDCELYVTWPSCLIVLPCRHLLDAYAPK